MSYKMMETLYVAFLALNDGPVTCVDARLIPLVMRKLALLGHPGLLSRMIILHQVLLIVFLVLPMITPFSIHFVERLRTS